MPKYRDEFFRERGELLNKNHVYRNHINKYIEYLSLPEVQLSNAPARIDINVVEECIKYYRDKGELNSRSTMESHLESIKSFYDYLRDTGKAVYIFSNWINRLMISRMKAPELEKRIGIYRELF